MVCYINTSPIYEIWKDTVCRNDWQMIEAPPSTLNKLLAAGELDLGFVSSYEYAQRPERYRILSDLSISATGQVGSVFLFSHVELGKLNAQEVLLTSQSDTSIALTKIILEEFYKVSPRYCVGEVFGEKTSHAAVLAIGDEALRLFHNKTYAFAYDLGEVWKKYTNLPFVFAVFAVQEEFCQTSPMMLGQIHAELVRCKNTGKSDLHAICQRIAHKVPMTVEDCCHYLHGIEYDLTKEKQQGLSRFFEILIQRGEAHADSLPLKIHALTS